MRYANMGTTTDLLASAINEKVPRAIDKYVLIVATDVEGMIVGVSRAFCALSGFTSAELTGRSYALLRHPQMASATFEALWSTIQGGEPWVGEMINRTKEEGLFWVVADISQVRGEDDTIIGYIAVYQDITGLKALETLTLTDPMTNAYNRRHFEAVMPVELARARRDRMLLCFLMVDADNFKRYNDTYGHHAGDDVIKAIVNAMHKGFRRPSDLVFRLGGEEFAVLYQVKNSDVAFSLADKMRQSIYDQNMEHTGNQPMNCVTVSMGLIVISPDDTGGIDDIYKYSDLALYRAKENGRNRVELHGDVEADVDLF